MIALLNSFFECFTLEKQENIETTEEKAQSNDMKVDEAIQFLIDRIKRTKSNNEFLDTMSQ